MANTQLKSAQAQKALSQAREIDTRAKMQLPKLALEAMAQQHNQQLEREAHGHQRGMDATNALFKGISALGGLKQQSQQAQQPSTPGAYPPQQIPGGD